MACSLWFDAPPSLSEDVRLEWTIDLPPRVSHGVSFHVALAVSGQRLARGLDRHLF